MLKSNQKIYFWSEFVWVFPPDIKPSLILSILHLPQPPSLPDCPPGSQEEGRMSPSSSYRIRLQHKLSAGRQETVGAGCRWGPVKMTKLDHTLSILGLRLSLGRTS